MNSISPEGVSLEQSQTQTPTEASDKWLKVNSLNIGIAKTPEGNVKIKALPLATAAGALFEIGTGVLALLRGDIGTAVGKGLVAVGAIIANRFFSKKLEPQAPIQPKLKTAS